MKMTERVTEGVCQPTQYMVDSEKSHVSGGENTSCFCWGAGAFVRLKYNAQECQHPRVPLS